MHWNLDYPLLILASGERVLCEDEVYPSERWLDLVEEEASTLLGIILPLELKFSKHCRSELKGIDLLRWLRWSGKGRVRVVPVLVTSWQPIEEILRLVPELLLVSSGTRFARLPDILDGNPSIIELFKQQVRNEPEKWRARVGDLDRLAVGGTQEAAQLSYHDLANDGYSALRLWAGYLRALKDAGGNHPPRKLTATLEWARTVSFDWQAELLRRQRQPAFQQFQIARRGSAPPKYPPVLDGSKIVLRHATDGLPPALRVLLVDDEYDKGIATVFLKMLFGNVEFTSRGPKDQEWIYSEKQGHERWVRFVCVKNTIAAYHWLKHWKECEIGPDAQDETAWTDWVRAWATALGRDPSATEIDDVLSQNSANQPAIDSRQAPPAKPITVILLDLRLKKGEPEVSYDPAEFESLTFRSAVKEIRPDMPVVMCTASRQAMNYAVAMEQAGPQDGWFTKEAPDVPIDDVNSSLSIQYLVERLHLFSIMQDWYRAELSWNSRQILSFNRLWQHPDRDALSQSVGDSASLILDAVEKSQLPSIGAGVRFFGFIKSQLPGAQCEVMPVLVARKVAVACLLMTADWVDSGPKWNVDRFRQKLPQGLLQRPKWKKIPVSAVYHVVNFKRDLWIPGSDVRLNWLLREEYEWLLTLNWADQAKQYIFACFQIAYPRSP